MPSKPTAVAVRLPPRNSHAPSAARPAAARFTALALALVALLAPLGAAHAAEPFAALTVTPTGRQQYDIATGITTLPDGGTITDLATGVALQAQEIEYLAGVYIKATGASVDGSFGRVSAAELHVDLKSGVLEAAGALSLVRDGLTITAGALHFDANREVAVFSGGVAANHPEFEADRLLLDVSSGDVLLDGRYEYHGVLFTMASPAGGGQLELRFVLRDGEPTYDAATEVRPELLRRFAAFL